MPFSCENCSGVSHTHTQGFGFEGTFYRYPKVLNCIQPPLNWLLSKKGSLEPWRICKTKSTLGHSGWFCPERTAVASAGLKSPLKRHVFFHVHKQAFAGPKNWCWAYSIKKDLTLHWESQSPESIILIPFSIFISCWKHVYMYYGKGIPIWVVGRFNFSAQVLPNRWPDFPQSSAFFVYKGHHGSTRAQSTWKNWSVLCSPLRSLVLWEVWSQCGCWSPEILPLMLLLKPTSAWMSIVLQWPHWSFLCDYMWWGNTAGEAKVSFSDD